VEPGKWERWLSNLCETWVVRLSSFGDGEVKVMGTVGGDETHQKMPTFCFGLIEEVDECVNKKCRSCAGTMGCDIRGKGGCEACLFEEVDECVTLVGGERQVG